VPKMNVEKGTYLLPAGVSFEVGVFIEPLACVVRGQRLAEVGGGDTVLVIGSGVSGLLHVQLAGVRGADKVIATDISTYKLNAAKKFGADEAVIADESMPEKVKEFNGGRLADKVIVCAGAKSATEQAMRCVDRGGTILFFAVPPPGQDVAAPLVDFWRNEVTLKTSYGAAPKDLEESLKLISKKRLNVRQMITHRFGLADVQKAFELVASGGDSLKVIIEPQK
ncbi:MAG: zinc-binding dehydrogenase, partial [Candidatus Hadarchaeota archaeon]